MPQFNWVISRITNNPLTLLDLAAVTLIGADVPVIELLTVSVAVMVWLPSDVSVEVINSSRIASIGGLVTCANNCLK